MVWDHYYSPYCKHSYDFHSDDESEKKTLSESAAEYTESHTNKRKYDVVDVVTGDKTKRSSSVQSWCLGEEAESNVLQGQVVEFNSIDWLDFTL